MAKARSSYEGFTPCYRRVGWAQVRLASGQAKVVQITLGRDDLEDLHVLEYWDTATGDWATASGTYTVHVGSSSQISLDDTFSVPRT